MIKVKIVLCICLQCNQSKEVFKKPVKVREKRLVNINQPQLMHVIDMIDVSFLDVYLPYTTLIKGLKLSPIDLIARNIRKK